ncbi:MAG: Xaa-Pro dipeptidase [Thermobacillus sp. ZCTH02-B1]|uniref:M24 family metallopeptidase n=1 Tax=Thermobacillus sp. ZCTH02-B1 TaxID=1858795 RepID=UPI000B57846D|nr:Xaa-Pro peptidase family protein [Thermobacillus sp. ZCTH02-B1]OUM96884.1 MAG: Xaa-Pro dipeptidase [Thermobacillus sp. ZCTH02-B1]
MNTGRRITALRAEMEKAGVEAMLVASGVNRRYLSGFTGTSGALLFTPGGQYLLTDFRYMTQAPAQAPDYRVVEHAPEMMDTVKELLAEAGVKRLGFEERHVSYADWASWSKKLAPVELVPLDGLPEKLRVRKDEDEIAVIRQAAKLADAAYAHILHFARPGVTELDLAAELEAFMRKNGASGPTFDTIVASGERSALPHGVAGTRKLQPGEFVTFDFGALYQGYCSDLTRTIVVGEPTDRHREIYGIVLEAQEHALANIRPGMTGREADALTRDVIARYGYGEFFGHGTGHGIGLEIHEAPRLSRHSDAVLEPGMVVTVEPGIYIPGFGGVRIEDDVVITESGIEVLTSSPKAFFATG